MKQLVHLFALPSREKPAQAYHQFLKDLSLKLEVDGAILYKFLKGKFLWYQIRKIDHLDAD